MNKPVTISEFLLERYRIGEVTSGEKRRVEEALAQDSVLTASLNSLNRADRDFRDRFPPERFFPEGRGMRHFRIRQSCLPRLRRIPPPVLGGCVAVLVLAVAFPFILKNSQAADFGERIKGNPAAGAVELSVYLKGERGNQAGGNIQLEDQAGVREGNTVQITYRVPAADSGGMYGVIFSIDGRSLVTLHYPYSPGQTTGLVSGKPVPLDEAYTLDDAPDYEIFFFVAGDKPLDPRNVLNTAEQLALSIAGNPRDALRQGTAVFKGYELRTLMLRKEQ